MRKIFMMMVMLSVVTVVATAQFQRPGQTDNQVFQSQQVMQPGVYEGTVYEPFSEVTPSEQSAVGASYSPANAPGQRRSFDHGAETGQSDEFPLGDALLPLTLLALAFSAFLHLRRRKVSNN